MFLAATCPCALRQSTDALGRISSTFYAKSGLGSPCSSHLEIWNYFYEQYLAADEPPVPASLYVAFGRIPHIFIVLVVPASLCSSHLKIWTLFLFAVIWRWDGVFGGCDAFFALLRVVPELSASFWSPRWRRVLCHRGLPMPISTGLCGYTHCLASDRVSNNQQPTTNNQQPTTNNQQQLRSHFGSSRGHSWPGLSQWLSSLHHRLIQRALLDDGHTPLVGVGLPVPTLDDVAASLGTRLRK